MVYPRDAVGWGLDSGMMININHEDGKMNSSEVISR